MSKPTKFTRPALSRSDRPDQTLTSSNLYVANCGPELGFSHSDIADAFSNFGVVVGVHPADDSGARVIVCYADESSAREAMGKWGGRSCKELGGRILHIQYSVVVKEPLKVKGVTSVCFEACELEIPGIYLIQDFISSQEEQDLLAEVDAKPWKNLAKRRVQHYGYEFSYETRNVDSEQFLGVLPSFVSQVLGRISLFLNAEVSEDHIDQLTVNEYPPGVGISPHIDTHSAFKENIFSLSLASSCVMEFRKYTQNKGLPEYPASNFNGNNLGHCSNFERKTIFLPPRSMLLMSREGRYAWHHYIPHHKADIVGDHVIRRGQRRVSFTFRKVRKGPCFCQYSEFCDSQGMCDNQNLLPIYNS